MRLLAAAGLAMLGLVVAPAPALALTCMFRPFQAAGERSVDQIAQELGRSLSRTEQIAESSD